MMIISSSGVSGDASGSALAAACDEVNDDCKHNNEKTKNTNKQHATTMERGAAEAKLKK